MDSAQSRPQEPQLGSACRSTQAPSQSWSPPRQWQPPKQKAPGGQTLPQPPQFSGSTRVSVHFKPVPAGHTSSSPSPASGQAQWSPSQMDPIGQLAVPTHSPQTQFDRPGHALPQAPQLFGSLSSMKQEMTG
jgi:hypothetical protein